MAILERRYSNFFLLALILTISLYRVWLLIIYNFSVPAPDFLSFRNRAILMENGKIHWGDKRLPLFPLMLMIFAQPFKLFGIEYPYLIGAHVINVISVGLSVPLLYLINKRILKKTVLALLSTFLFFINPEYLTWNLQPILDTFFVFAVLLNFYLYFFKRLELKYFGVCFASLIRYEAVLLAPIFVLDDIIFKKETKNPIILGSMAMLPLFFWVFSVYILNNIPAYLLQVQIIGSHVGVMFLYTISKTVTFGIYYGLSGMRFLITCFSVFLIFVVGFIFFHRDRSFISLFLWFGGYAGLHMYYSFDYYRFVLPILWLVITICVYGVNLLFHISRKKIKYNFSKFHKIVFMILSISVFSFYQFYNKNYVLNALIIDIFFVITIMVLISIVFVLETADQRKKKFELSFVLIILFIMTFAATFNGDIRTNTLAYQMIQFRKVGEWYKIVAKEGDILVATSPGMIQYYSGLPDEYFLRTNEFHSNTTAEFIEELKSRGVTYVVWDSKQGNRPKDYYYYLLNVELISFLSDGTDKPHFKVVHTVNIRSHIAYVYKFSP